jgi:tetratricopeptide (TPR) repeat protein
MKKRSAVTQPFSLFAIALSLVLWSFIFVVVTSAVSAAPPTSSPISTQALEQTFKQNQQKALDLEHQGDKKKALEVIRSTATALKSLPPYNDHRSQLRIRVAELELQNKLENDCFHSVEQIISDSQQIIANAAADGDLWLEIGYLKDLLVRYAEDNDSLQSLKLAHRLCETYRETRCKPKDTLEPLCRSEVRHKDWIGLQGSASDLLLTGNDSLTQLTGLTMLQLSYSKQGLTKKAKEAEDKSQKMMKLSHEANVDERALHREVALVQNSVLNYKAALTEIKAALALDEKLPRHSGQTQVATDMGIKAQIETASGQFDDAIRDAKQADKLWNSCDPSIWKSSASRTLSQCHADALAALEQSLRAKHLNKEADEARARRKQIFFLR